MDVYIVYGGFVVVLIDDLVWVMNVNLFYVLNIFGVVYDWGLIGIYNDWCEVFLIYFCIYDFLYVVGFFIVEGYRCEMKDVMLEFDRILRFGVLMIFRDGYVYLE